MRGDIRTLLFGNADMDNAVKFSGIPASADKEINDIVTGGAVGIAGGDYYPGIGINTDYLSIFILPKKEDGSYDWNKIWTELSKKVLSDDNFLSNKAKSAESLMLQKLFWRSGGEIVLKDDPVALEMLKHSLDINPNTITEKDIPIVIDKLKENSELKDAITNKMNSIGNEVKKLDDENTSVSFKLGKNEDLFFAIGKANVFISGENQENGKWNLLIRIEDKYNFDEIIADYSDGLKSKLGAAANNAAFLSQNMGAINEFNAIFTFQITYPFD